RDAAEMYRKASREDLAAQEDSEVAILEQYLPRQMTADELRPQLAGVIEELGASSIADMGKIMPVLMQRFKGQADGRVISQLAREILTQQ
ncbi:MAG TPA: GatB/YqeY domain-containing protein, partial [Roseiflexaceae bacterium]|nr:GatB/YqeY domain-containing protein [Roseiflexaceae bacterium]